MSNLFTEDQIKEIRRRLYIVGGKDSEFVKAGPLTGDETIALVQGGVNKKTSLQTFLSSPAMMERLSEYYTRDEIDLMLNWYNPEGGSGNVVDLRKYLTKTEAEESYAKKDDIPEIPSFKTINGQSIIGVGNITIKTTGGTSTNPGDTTVTDGTYEPTIEEETKITTSIGSIKAGSKLKSLAGKSYSEIIDAMLVEETWNDPHYEHTISMSVPKTIVEVGDSVVEPTIVANWNPNIQSNGTKEINTTLTKIGFVDSSTVYSKAGEYTFKLTYDYIHGYYDITSNLGNTKRIEVPGKLADITRTVNATYPWYIDSLKQELVAIDHSKTIETTLLGSPTIEVPFVNSNVKIEVDLGFGWQPAVWDEYIEDADVTGLNVPYKVYKKPDAYAVSVKHRITITLIQ